MDLKKVGDVEVATLVLFIQDMDTAIKTSGGR